MTLKWNEFLNESNITKPRIVKYGEKEIWTLSIDEIREMFYDITDEGYGLWIQYGFNRPDSRYIRNNRGKYRGIFTQKVFPLENAGHIYRPSYFVEIYNNYASDIDISSNLRSICSYLSEDYDIMIVDDDHYLDINKILIKGGMFSSFGSFGSDDGTYKSIEGSLGICISQKNEIVFDVDCGSLDFFNWGVISDFQ